MKRDSSHLLINIQGINFSVPWVSDAPDFNEMPTELKAKAEVLWQAFVASGDELEVIDDPVPTTIIRSINMRRLRLALLQLELLDDIDAVVAAQPRSAQIEWEFAIEVKADHPLVVQFVAALNLDIDAIIDLAESFT